MKRCKTCGEHKPLEDFHRTTKSKDGRRAHCKACRNLRERTEMKAANDARVTAWIKRHPERARAIRQRFHARHPDAQREYAQRWRERGGQALVLAAKHRRRWGRTESDLLYADALLADPCSYCGEPADTVDHIEPTAIGGPNGWHNLTAACRSCNSRKSERSLLTFLATR